MATQAGTVKKIQSDFQYMEIGVAYEVQLPNVPVLDAKGLDTGSFGDALFNFNRIGKLMFTDEVETVGEVSANGEWHIDCVTGLFTGQPAMSGYAKVWYQTKEVVQP